VAFVVQLAGREEGFFFLKKNIFLETKFFDISKAGKNLNFCRFLLQVSPGCFCRVGGFCQTASQSVDHINFLGY
jgi:hypothetical protein